jgi:uncharacterized cupredoxin-like copper-binding protein
MNRLFTVFVALAVFSAVTIGAVTAFAVTDGSGTVKVTMKEWGFARTPVKVRAGKVTLLVKNIGHLDHEFLVLKTKTAASKLPVKGTTAVVTGLVGKLKQFKPGLTKTLTLTLKPGHYVLICNLPAHYKAGQHVDFTVG